MSTADDKTTATDKSPDQMLAEANAMVEAGNQADAIVLLNQAHALDPNHTGVLERIGLMFFQVRHFDQAVSCFERLTLLDKTNGDFWANLGAVYTQAGRAHDSVKALQKSLQLQKNNADACYHLGVAYRHLKNTNMARYAFREAIKHDPQLGLAYYELGQTYMESGSTYQAIDQYQKAIQATPTLQVARDALDAAKQRDDDQKNRQQFGRLVKMDDLSQKAVPGGEETQEAASLVAHYAAVKAILKSFVPAATDLATQINDELCVAIREAMRLITSNEDPAELIHIREEFRNQLRVVAAKRKELRKLVARFAAHAEMASGRQAG